ncbi:MAG: dihydroxyacetone kinase subunit DhaL [Actinobacteria bacterium]|nr:dihydroxyacetone kinase subunit DhaL [Actinomycetota bacterium]
MLYNIKEDDIINVTGVNIHDKKDFLTLADFRIILSDINQMIQSKKDYISEVDSFIGDGDHGITLAGGFRAAIDDEAQRNADSISSFFVSIGMAIMRSTGGVTGPIYGSIFIGLGKAAASKDKIYLSDFVHMMETALGDVKARGGAKVGDKTLIDALGPAVEALRKAANDDLNFIDAMKEASDAAKAGMLSTKDMISNMGKSKSLGERSKGYIDAGATSFYLITRQISDSVNRILDLGGAKDGRAHEEDAK